MSRLVARSFLTAFLSGVLLPGSTSAWILLGTVGDDISFPVDVFIDPNSVEDLGEGRFLVETLNVYPHMIAGIDLFGQTGGHVYDTRFPHRSYVLTAVYDCPRRMTAKVRTVYFAGARPISRDEVYHLVEREVVFMGEYPGIPSESLVLDKICDPKRQQNFDLLSRIYSGQEQGRSSGALSLWRVGQLWRKHVRTSGVKPWVCDMAKSLISREQGRAVKTHRFWYISIVRRFLSQQRTQRHLSGAAIAHMAHPSRPQF